MSTPAIWNETFKNKASGYTRAEAEAAIADCHAALKTNPEASASYVMKTWCEIDAMRARIAELAKGRKVAHWSASCSPSFATSPRPSGSTARSSATTPRLPTGRKAAPVMPSAS